MKGARRWLGLLAASLFRFALSGEPAMPEPASAAEAGVEADDGGVAAFLLTPPVGLVPLGEAIDDALDYLTTRIMGDGRFVYVAYARTAEKDGDDPAEDRYNLLRHAGAMFALAEGAFRERDRDARGVPGAAERLEAVRRVYGGASAYLRRALGAVPGTKDALAVWSSTRGGGLPDPKKPDEREAKLGGAGLALIAAARMEMFASGASGFSAGQLKGLGRFVLSLQRADGSFVSKVDEGAEPDDFDSLYYPGEAALGLTLLARIDADADDAALWRSAGRKALLYLARTRAGSADVPPDHWSLLATRAVLEDWPAGTDGEGREALIVHAAQVMGKMLGEQVFAPRDPALDGGFRRDGTLCPTAIRLEGLLAAMAFLDLDAEPEIRRWLGASVSRGTALLLRNQVREGRLRGGMPRASRPEPPPDDAMMRDVSGAEERTFAAAMLERERRRVKRFNRRVGEIRVDYVQHAACAFMELERRMTRGSERSEP